MGILVKKAVPAETAGGGGSGGENNSSQRISSYQIDGIKVCSCLKAKREKRSRITPNQLSRITYDSHLVCTVANPPC